MPQCTSLRIHVPHTRRASILFAAMACQKPNQPLNWLVYYQMQTILFTLEALRLIEESQFKGQIQIIFALTLQAKYKNTGLFL